MLAFIVLSGQRQGQSFRCALSAAGLDTAASSASWTTGQDCTCVVSASTTSSFGKLAPDCVFAQHDLAF